MSFLLFSGGPVPPVPGQFAQHVLDTFNPGVMLPLSDEGPSLAMNLGTLGGTLDGIAFSDPVFEEPALLPGLSGAVEFDGTSAFESSTGVVGGADPTWWVAAWISTTAGGTGVYQTIVQQRDAAAFLGQFQLVVYPNGSVSALGYNTGGVYEISLNSGGVLVNDGNPHFVCLTVDGAGAGVATLYVDAVQTAQDTSLEGGSYNSALNLCVGRDQRDNDDGFIGHISDVVVSQSAVPTAAQIYQMYLEGRGVRYIEVDSIDGSVVPTGPAQLALLNVVGTTQYVDMPSIDGSSRPRGPFVMRG